MRRMRVVVLLYGLAFPDEWILEAPVGSGDGGCVRQPVHGG
jgi:hypothetical protein